MNKTDKIKNIYELKLHEEISINKADYIKRVAGGWIYYFISNNQAVESSVFVPFNNEFMGGQNE